MDSNAIAKVAAVDPNVDLMVTNKRPPEGRDILATSANNLYVGLTMKDLEGYKESHPLNSRLVKQNGKIVEEVYRVGGRYGSAIAAIVGHLEAAKAYAMRHPTAELGATIEIRPVLWQDPAMQLV